MLYDLCIEWIKNRQKVRQKLNKLADELNKHQKNVNIAKVTGSSAAIVGTGLAIGGFVASFFTFGASLIVSAVGAGIGGAGGVTAGGASIAKYFLDKKIYDDVQKSIDRDQELTKKLKTLLKEVKIQVDSVKKEELEELDSNSKGGFKIAVKLASCAKLLGKNIVFDAIQAANELKNAARLPIAVADLATDTGVNFFRSLSTLGRAAHIGGFVFGVVFLPLDIHTLVTSSIQLHRGNVSEAENKIRAIIEELTCPAEEEIPDMIKAYLVAELLAD